MEKLSNYQQLVSQDKLKTGEAKKVCMLRVFTMAFPKPFVKFPSKCYTMILYALFNTFITYTPPQKSLFGLVCAQVGTV